MEKLIFVYGFQICGGVVEVAFETSSGYFRVLDRSWIMVLHSGKQISPERLVLKDLTKNMHTAYATIMEKKKRQHYVEEENYLVGYFQGGKYFEEDVKAVMV